MKNLMLLSITFFIATFPLYSHSSQDKDIYRKAFGPIMDISLSKGEEILLLTVPEIEKHAIGKLLPNQIKPNNLLNRDSIEAIIYDEIPNYFTPEQAKKWEKVMSSKAGELLVNSLKISMKENRNIYDVFNEISKNEDIKKYNEDLSKILDGNDFKELNDSLAKLQLELNIKISKKMESAINDYYKKNKFKKNDSELCLISFESGAIDLYAVTVCRAGYKSKDYTSSLKMAALYRQGREIFLERDIELSKKIYRKLLSKDKTGEAHYYLAMLIKNVPNKHDKPQESYCLLTKAASFEFPDAASALKDFSNSEKFVRCK